MDLVETEATDAPAQYTCPMHPEVVSDEPGSCPKCGMDLVESEPTAAPAQYSCPMHPEVVSDEPGSCPKCGMDLVETEASAAPAQYSCPMHPEVVSDQPGSCPKCGIDLVQTEATAAPAQYSCPMHPEVVSDQPGSCPKCGMDLVETEATAAPAQYTCPMHREVVSDQPGSCPKCGMDLVESEPTAAPVQYTCPMHPEVVSDEPGSCPKCGMDLVQAEANDDHAHHGHDHGGHDHALGPAQPGVDGVEPGFMSMVELTQGTPRSSDGLQMEWITASFGPFFPGLPGGLLLDFELDGDTVAQAHVASLVAPADLLENGPLSGVDFVESITRQMPLAPVSYRLLACLALEAAANLRPSDAIAQARNGALERERIASHLRWLSQLGRQLGLGRIAADASALHQQLRDADWRPVTALAPRLAALGERVARTPFLTRRLTGIGRLPADAPWHGPDDERHDAAGRLAARLADMSRSMELIQQAGAIAPPELTPIGEAAAAATKSATASVQTPRGAAELSVELDAGMVVSASLQTPSARHIDLVGPVTAQRELADALVAVASLDLNPWEITA